MYLNKRTVTAASCAHTIETVPVFAKVKCWIYWLLTVCIYNTYICEEVLKMDNKAHFFA